MKRIEWFMVVHTSIKHCYDDDGAATDDDDGVLIIILNRGVMWHVGKNLPLQPTCTFSSTETEDSSPSEASD